MRVAGGEAAVVLDADLVPIAAGPCGEHLPAGVQGDDHGDRRDRDVETRMQGGPGHPGARDDRPGRLPYQLSGSWLDGRRRALELRGELRQLRLVLPGLALGLYA